MKKLFILFAIGTATLSMSSCGSKDPDPTVDNNPSISVTPSTDQTAAPGASVAFAITANSNATSAAKLTKLEIKVESTSGTIGTYDSTYTIAKQSNYGATHTYMVPALAADGSSYVITFTLTDEKAATTSTKRTITVKAVSTLNSWSATMILVPSADKKSKTFYSTSDNTLYSRNDLDGSAATQAKIDIAYYYGASNKASLTSPASFPSTVQDLSAWTTKNATMFVTLSSSFDFTNATSSSIATAVGSPSNGTLTGLSVGDMIGFKTVAGKYGVAKVTAINGTYNDGDNMKIDVKVQK